MGLFHSVFKKVKQSLSRTASSFTGIFSPEPLSQEAINNLEKHMLQADIGLETTRQLTLDLQAGWERSEIKTGTDAQRFLIEQLTALWHEEDRAIQMNTQPGPTVILVAGINGAGKTTSIAKIAKAMKDQGHRVLLAACDTFRAGAVKQLEIWAQRLDVQIVKGQQGADPAAVAFDAADAALARDIDVLIVDTAGRLHTQKHLMDQLAKIQRVIAKKIPSAPHEVILVLDATIGQNAVNQALQFAKHIDITGIFLSKLDGTAKGGIVVAIREILNIPVKFVGVGETPEDVEPFEPEKFVTAMFDG